MKMSLVAAGFVTLLLSLISAPQTMASGDTSYKIWATPVPLTQDGSKCVGFALETWERSAPSPMYNAALSGDTIFAQAYMNDGIRGPHYGTTLNAGVKVLQDAGIVKWVRYSQNPDEIRNFILNNGPVVFVSPWHYDMTYEPPDGYAIPVGPVDYWHAYECNDWVSSGVDGQSLGCINNWGSYWNGARLGHFRIHLNDEQTLIREGAYAALLTK